VPISKEKPMIASSVKAEVVKSNARSANDTGSPEVQVALLTARINEQEVASAEPLQPAIAFVSRLEIPFRSLSFRQFRR
jgi:hypothetical protein